MRTAKNLFARLSDPDHLEQAADLTVRGKRRRPEVAQFLFRREAELARLHEELITGSYRPGDFDLLFIHDPKPRLIARLPIADRVMQTALVSLMEPIFLRSLRPEAFACRKGYGTHRAVLRLLELMRRYRFALHLDIRSYFASIHHGILRRLLARRIRDVDFLAVIDRVLEGGAGIYDRLSVRSRAGLVPGWPPPGRGLPIGSYTSQLFAAQVYLGALDHFVKRELCVPGYLRYVDDIFFFADHRSTLRACRKEVGTWLRRKRALRLKHPKARLLSCHGQLHALGHRVTRDGFQVLPRALRRFQRRMVEHFAGLVDIELEGSMASFAGGILF